MYTLADLPDTIPLFPLTGVLLFRRCKLPLVIFEPRYVAMISDTLKSEHRLVGMIQPKADSEDDLFQIGCAGRIIQVVEVEGGRFGIILEGVSRFRLRRQVDGFVPYRRGLVRWPEFEIDLGDPETDASLNRKKFLKLFDLYCDHAGIQCNRKSLKREADDLLINAVSMGCELTPSEKQALLELRTLTERRAALETLLSMALADTEAKTLQ
ncbi:MAG: LON peptidase substrate-binding domain-containing protein [Rhodobacteraceae bacterium]|nr:LON peptidase substrate-binding domain-containing protein [Paracoccaceae bacterium]